MPPTSLPSVPQHLPRVFVLGTSVTCGVLLALAVYVFLGDVGLDMAAAWRRAAPVRSDQLASALAWWLIAASGFAGSFVAVVIIRASADGSPLGRWLLRISAAAFVVALAAVSHTSVGLADMSPAVRAGASLGALALGAFMALCGARVALQTAEAAVARARAMARVDRRRRRRRAASLQVPQAPATRAEGRVSA
jgi:hypothetical protein